MPTKNRSTLQKAIQAYADLVIAPKTTERLTARRLVAAQQAIRLSPAIALDLAQMAKGAPRDLPFEFTALDAWRIAVDAQHIQRQGGAA